MTNKKSNSYQISTRTCHNGPVKLLENRGLSLYGASRTEAEISFYNFDLVISLEFCKPINNSIITGSNISSVELRRLINSTEHLKIDWPDFGIPQLDKDFWIKLSYFLRKKGRDRERFGKTYKVMVHCMGGHGRTGTALAILANMCTDEGWKDEDLLCKIRENHCSKAVENSTQIKYIERMTGVKISKSDKGSKTGTRIVSFNYKNSYEPDAESYVERYIKDNEIGGKGGKKETGEKDNNSIIRGIKPITEEEIEQRRKDRELKENVKEQKKCPCCKTNPAYLPDVLSAVDKRCTKCVLNCGISCNVVIN